MAPYTATVERQKKNRVEVTVTFDPSLSSPAEETALQRLGQNVKIEGFRPGKAPVDMLRKQIDSQRLFEETVRILLQQHLGAILEEHKVQPIIPPRVEAVSREPVTMKVIFVERPVAKVKGADKIKIAKKEMPIEQKYVDGIMEQVRDQHAVKKTVDRPVQDGDEVVMSFHGTDAAGKDIPGASADNYEIRVGSHQLVPGFEEALIGVAPGGAKTFTVTMPEKYHAEELAGKPMTFAVSIKEVREVERPELNDAFVKAKLGQESMAKWKEEIEGNIRAQDERFSQMQREQELMEAIRKNTQVELADELIDEEMRVIIEEFAGRLQQRGQTLQDWLTQTKKKAEDAEKEFRSQAEERLTVRLGIAALIEDKKIELSQEEMDQLAKDVVGGGKVSQEEVTDRMNNAIWRTKVEKLVKMMLEQ